MTKLFNDPARFSEDMLEGFLDAYQDWVVGVPGGCIRAEEPKEGKVSVIVGGGSGHYPAFCGIVGPGYADGAVVGNIFTSPSTDDCYNVSKAAEVGGGVLIMAGNYAGDVLNFDAARDQLRGEGVAAETLYVTDDVASAPEDEIEKRRGIAGDCVVFKIASAAAEAGYSLDEVVKVASRANDVTRSMGLGLDGCTLPGAKDALFHVPKGRMGVGLGIHGEPGISEEDLPSADEVADLLVDRCLAEAPQGHSGRIAVILNGLGATKYEELFVVWSRVSKRLRDEGYTIVEPDVGELVTSLDMAGLSLTVAWLDEELEKFWRAPANTPAYRKGSLSFGDSGSSRRVRIEKQDDDMASNAGGMAGRQVSSASREAAAQAVSAFEVMAKVLAEHEEELGNLDSFAGDGDHGRGMVRGSSYALKSARRVFDNGGGLSAVIISAGKAFGDKAGGTSGALWGVGLKAFGETFDDVSDEVSRGDVITAVGNMCEAIKTQGRAKVGDKTMVDTLEPFYDVLKDVSCSNLKECWSEAAKTAMSAARATKLLSPSLGRARPLAHLSVGHEDPGAMSMALIIDAISRVL